MYEEGKGVEQALKQAISWYSKAAKQDLSGAQERLNSLLQEGQ